MSVLVVVDKLADWPVRLPSIRITSARSYLTDPAYLEESNLRVYNLCRSYRYQSSGYYVSLLASARGHRPTPNIATLKDMKLYAIKRMLSEDINDLIQSSLRSIQGRSFSLSIYFGRNIAKKYDRLASALYDLFEAPLLRAHFSFDGGKWRLKEIGPITPREVPELHLDFLYQRSTEYFLRSFRPKAKRRMFRHEIAILYGTEDRHPPSNKKAIARFLTAAAAEGLWPEIITRDDYARIAEFDGLFIRQTTQVNHYTYQFSRRAEAEGLPVLDDPESIIRCSNKVYLAEILKRHKVPAPPTQILLKDQAEQVKDELTYPLVLKLPDSAFSQGVRKILNPSEFLAASTEFFKKTDLLVAQAFVPTSFDWRICVLDRKFLFACKYNMAREHWQVIRTFKTGRFSSGKVECVPAEKVPAPVIALAIQAAGLIGGGLYGVDIKECDGNYFVIEINDNPNIDYGYEDRLLRGDIYRRIMRFFKERIEMRHAEDLSLRPTVKSVSPAPISTVFSKTDCLSSLPA